MWNVGPCVKPDGCKSKFIGTPPSVPDHYTDKAPHSTKFCLPSSSHLVVRLSLYASVNAFCSPQSFLQTQRSTFDPHQDPFTIGVWNCQFTGAIPAFPSQSFQVLAFTESSVRRIHRPQVPLVGAFSFYPPRHVVFERAKSREQVC